ncbi:hypothetical protein [Streptomyces sp. URMC 124]|uniref:hypothetical protein n=1 Tax=Streptomyces sp. URMC 124 TaxID=3423405 RepID=UPI003F1B3DED
MPAPVVPGRAMPGRVRVVVRPGDRRRAATVLLGGCCWAVRRGRGGVAALDVHWSVDPDAPGSARWVSCADVLRCGRPSPCPGAAALRAMRLLDRHPGCLLSAVPAAGDGLVIGVRGGRLLTGEATGPAEAAVLASYVHGRVVAGAPLEPLTDLVVGALGRTG